MKITVEDFEKIVKSPHFLYVTSTNWLALEIIYLKVMGKQAFT